MFYTPEEGYVSACNWPAARGRPIEVDLRLGWPFYRTATPGDEAFVVPPWVDEFTEQCMVRDYIIRHSRLYVGPSPPENSVFTIEIGQSPRDWALGNPMCYFPDAVVVPVSVYATGLSIEHRRESVDAYMRVVRSR
jgi:hypothetical protein